MQFVDGPAPSSGCSQPRVAPTLSRRPLETGEKLLRPSCLSLDRSPLVATAAAAAGAGSFALADLLLGAARSLHWSERNTQTAPTLRETTRKPHTHTWLSPAGCRKLLLAGCSRLELADHENQEPAAKTALACATPPMSACANHPRSRRSSGASRADAGGRGRRSLGA